MSKSQSITVAAYENGFSVTLDGRALTLKKQALAIAEPIKKVTNAEEQTAAINAAATIKGLISSTEKEREAVKKPYWDAGKAIDAKAKEFVKELSEAAASLEKMVASFQLAERNRIAEEERKRAEEARKAAEAVETERARIAKLEADKAAAELAASQATSQKDRDAARAESERLENERMEAEFAAMEAADIASDSMGLMIISPEVHKAVGAAISEVIDYEIEDIEKFYEWDLARRKWAKENNRIFPTFCKIEIKRADFKIFLSAQKDAEELQIPGLKITKTAKAAVRGVAPSLTLK